MSLLSLFDVCKSQGIDCTVIDGLLLSLNRRSAEYAAMNNRNNMVRAIAEDISADAEHVKSVFGCRGPAHDALQEFLDAWLDWVDSSEECQSGSCACYEEDSTGWCRLDYID